MINIDINDIIKTFIKIEYSENNNNTYEIDESKKMIILKNSELNNNSGNSFFFEFNKIFTNNDANSYIYEEICLNAIKESLQGISFSFISFGETISNKFNFLYGNIKKDCNNINNYGLFIRFLSNLINNNNNKKYFIKLSYLLVYEDNLIDLTLYSNKKCDNLLVEEFLKNSFKIKDDITIIDKIKKKPFNNDLNKVILFLNKIINILLKFEEKGNNNIYSLSHICIIIYLLDNKEKIVSTISFLQLNGNEHLYKLENKKTSNNKNSIINSPINKSHFDKIKYTLGVQYTYDNIINCIKSNKYINNIISKNNDKKYEKISNEKDNIINNLEKEEENKQIKVLSKLGVVLYNICFGINISNIKYRIIGNIKPITGFVKGTRDTLLFVAKFAKIIKKININSNTIETEKKEKEQIFDLNYQINVQQKEIEKLKKTIFKKDEKISFLSTTYDKQISTLKKCFNFQGDINILISGDINSEEANFVRNINNTKNIIKKLELEINILKKQLENANQEIVKYKNISEIKENDQTMINYYLTAQNVKKNKHPIDEDNHYLINELNKEINNLKEKIIIKDKIIEGLKTDLDIKNNMISNLPKAIISQDDKKEKIIENNQSELNDTNIMLKNEIKKIKLNEQKNFESLKIKYDMIINEKKNKIYNLEQKLEGIEENYKNEINILNKELVRLYEILIYITTNYQIIFCNEDFLKEKTNIKNYSKKEEFDKIILNIDKDINYFNFNGLHKELDNQKKTKKSIIKTFNEFNTNEIYKNLKVQTENIEENSKAEEIINKVEDKEISKNVNEKDNNMEAKKDDEISKLNKKLLRMAHYLDEQVAINNNNKIIINSQKRTIEKMQKDSFIFKHLLKYKLKKQSKIKSQYDSPLTSYRNTLIKNNSIFQNLNSDNSQRKNRVIKDYKSFVSSQINNESINYISNMSKIYNKNESPNNGSFQQITTRSNNIELRGSSNNTLISNNTKNTSLTNRLKSPKKVFHLKKSKRSLSSYINRKINN